MPYDHDSPQRRGRGGGPPCPADHPDGKALRAAWIDMVRVKWAAFGRDPAAYRVPPAYDGGTDPRSGRRYRPVWDGLAAKARAHGADPVRLLAYLFAASPPGGVPDLKRVGNADAAAAYAADTHQAVGRLGAELTADEMAFAVARRRYASRYPAPESSLVATLADPDAGSALFRFAAAVRYRAAAALDRLAHPAAVQLAAQPGYPTAWARVLTPDVLAALATRIRRTAS